MIRIGAAISKPLLALLERRPVDIDYIVVYGEMSMAALHASFTSIVLDFVTMR